VPGAGCVTVASAIFSGGSQPVAATVNQIRTGTSIGTDYEGVAAPSKYAVVPLWKNQPGTWISGLVVQSIANQTNVTVTYYDSSGNQYGSPVSLLLAAHALYIANQTGPSTGSLVVTADQPVAVMANQSVTTTGDGGMSYTAIHR
jgi:hypothetical protein